MSTKNILDHLRQLEDRGPFKTEPGLLLHPNIPKPLHGLNPRTVRGVAWWDKMRAEAAWKSWNRCAACGVHKGKAKYHRWLEAHEAYNIDYKKGRVELERIVVLCHACHNYIHDGRMDYLVEDSKMTVERRAEILTHGKLILRRADLEDLEPEYPTECAPWGKWHLIIDGVKYPTRFKNEIEWEKYYRGV